VDGVFGNERASFGDSIWTLPQSGNPDFLFEDNTVFIREKGTIVHAYCTETGEVLDLTQATPTNPKSHPHYHVDKGLHHTSHHQQNGHYSHSQR
jgi:hypothetical protein